MWDSAGRLSPLTWLDGQAVVGEGAPWALAGDDGARWLAPDWQGTVGDAPRDPWGATLDASGTDPLGLGYRGEIEFDGETWLRSRVYEPATRCFLLPDPMAPVPGIPSAANPYHYAADNPIGLSDPLGLHPISEADLQEYRDRMDRNIWERGVDFVSDNWEYIAAGALIVAGGALMFTGVGGPLGVAIIAGGSGLISAGASVAVQRLTTGEVDWGQVAIAGAVGVVSGGAGAGAAAALSSTARVAAMSPLARTVVVNGADAVIGGGIDRGLTGGNIFNPRAIATDLMTGGVAPAAAGDLGDDVARAADPPPGFVGFADGPPAIVPSGARGRCRRGRPACSTPTAPAATGSTRA